MRNPLARIPMLLSLTAMLAMILASSLYAAAQESKSAVEQVLLTQQDAWNRHDLDAFMAGYWNSPDLTFFSGDKEQHGWQATIDRYKARYASPGHEMGKLEFSNLRDRKPRPRGLLRPRRLASNDV